MVVSLSTSSTAVPNLRPSLPKPSRQLVRQRLLTSANVQSQLHFLMACRSRRMRFARLQQISRITCSQRWSLWTKNSFRTRTISPTCCFHTCRNIHRSLVNYLTQSTLSGPTCLAHGHEAPRQILRLRSARSGLRRAAQTLQVAGMNYATLREQRGLFRFGTDATIKWHRLSFWRASNKALELY
jgi:hypothetical protein